MNLFSFFLIIILIFLYKKYNLKEFFIRTFALMIVCYIFFNSAIFYSFSFKTIMCYEFLEYVVLFLSIIFLYQNGIRKKQLVIFLLWYVFIIINILLIKVFPSNIASVTYPNTWSSFLLDHIAYYPMLTKQVLLYAFYFTIIPIIVFGIKNTFNDKEIYYIGEKIFYYSAISLAISCIQYVFVFLNLLDLFYYLRDLIFGSYIYSANIIIRNNIFSFYGFCSEPSAMAFAIFCFQFLLLIYCKSNKTRIILFCLTSLLGFFTGSLSYLIYILALITIIIFNNFNIIINFSKKHLRLLSVLIFIILLVFYIAYQKEYFMYYIDRIIRSIRVVLGDEIGYSSETERLLSIKYTFNAFLSRSFFGVGIGTVYCFSAFFSLLAEIGIIGIIIFNSIIIYFFDNFKNKRHLAYYIIIFIIYITLGSLSAFIYPEFYLIMLMVYNYFFTNAQFNDKVCQNE